MMKRTHIKALLETPIQSKLGLVITGVQYMTTEHYLRKLTAFWNLKQAEVNMERG